MRITNRGKEPKSLLPGVTRVTIQILISEADGVNIPAFQKTVERHPFKKA